MMITTNPINLIPNILSKVQDIIENTKKPKSILQIKEEYQLSYPFKVLRVRDSTNASLCQGVSVITEIYLQKSIRIGDTKKDAYVTNNNYVKTSKTRFYQSAEVEDYILFEEE